MKHPPPTTTLPNMTRLLHVLVVAGVALSAASGASLILNPASTIPLQLEAPLQLECGVEGNYRHCFWESHEGRVFQVEDVHAGLHGGLRAPHNLTHNQCGIVVEKGSGKDAGEWTCHVLLEGDSLRGVRTVSQACTPPFESIGTGCFYFSEFITKSWADARTSCKSLSPNADLAVLDDCHLLQLVWNHILVNYGANAHWIGATNEYTDENFYWVDGSSVVMGMPFWYPGYPKLENCVVMSSNYGYFLDYDCNHAWHFICQQNM